MKRRGSGATRTRRLLPASFVTSCCFGGDGGRDLYVTTADNTEDPARRGTVFRTRVDTAGAPVHMATI